MKTQDEILACLSKLSEYLHESHRDEVDNDHHGDVGECSYCQALEEADAILEEQKARPPEKCSDCGGEIDGTGHEVAGSHLCDECNLERIDDVRAQDAHAEHYGA